MPTNKPNIEVPNHTDKIEPQIFNRVNSFVASPPETEVTMSGPDKELLIKIRKHLYDLHTEWSQKDNDGHHKSNEGWVGYSVSYPNWFEAYDYLNDEPEIYEVQVYSYLFGPHRLHEFSNLQEAWDEVKTWRYSNV